MLKTFNNWYLDFCFTGIKDSSNTLYGTAPELRNDHAGRFLILAEWVKAYLRPRVRHDSGCRKETFR